MADRTSIEWTDATWNPVKGCSRVSEGCRNCYAEVMAARFSDPGQWGHGLATRVTLPDGRTDHRWTGKTRFDPAALDQPLRWRKPRRIFVCSTADLFHETVSDEVLDKVFAVMALCRRHTFQVLTKRPERARAYLSNPRNRQNAADIAGVLYSTARWNIPDEVSLLWPLPNVWLLTSVEDQPTADARIPALLATPAAVRGVSVEPLLGPVDLTRILVDEGDVAAKFNALRPDAISEAYGFAGIDWVIVGGESGPGARPMHPDWARALRDQCQAAGVAFFFKQWGEWHTGYVSLTEGMSVFRQFNNFQQWVNKASTWVQGGLCLDAVGRHCKTGADFMRARDEGTFPVTIMHKVGKKAAGRLLDGREWNEMPAGAA